MLILGKQKQYRLYVIEEYKIKQLPQTIGIGYEVVVPYCFLPDGTLVRCVLPTQCSQHHS